MQALALVPGTSRSGITMTAALFCGLQRQAAARFSFLLSIPTIGAAASLALLELLAQPELNWGELLYAMLMSALAQDAERAVASRMTDTEETIECRGFHRFGGASALLLLELGDAATKRGGTEIRARCARG